MTNREMSFAVAMYGTVHVTLMKSGPTPPNCSLVGAGMTEKIRVKGLTKSAWNLNRVFLEEL